MNRANYELIPTEAEKTRFLKKVDQNGPIPNMEIKEYEGLDKCHKWTGNTPNQYGQCWINKRRVTSSRGAYAVHHGKLPKNVRVLHKCDNPICVNPNHLFLGTDSNNMIDRAFKKRSNQAVGNKHGRRKLWEFEVIEILRDRHNTAVQLSERYKVSKEAIYGIRKRKTWKHIELNN